MPNFLTEIGPLDNRRFLYQCVCGETVAYRRDHVRSGRKTSCGCASTRVMNRGRKDDPLYNIFYAHKLNKHWDSFTDFLAELGAKPFEGAWVAPKQAGTQIRPGNVCWSQPNRTISDHPNHRTDMHHQEFQENPVYLECEKELYAISEEDPNSWTHGLDQVTAESDSLKHEDPVEWQKRIESAAVDYAKYERRRQEEKAIESGKVSQTQVARLFRYQLVTACAEVMEEWHRTAMQKGVGRHVSVVEPVLKRGIDYITAAHIAITVTLDNLGRGAAFQSTLTKIKIEIGRRIDHQAFLNTIEALDPKSFDKINRWYLKNGEMGYEYKIGNARKTVPDLQYNFLSTADQLHLGDWAFTCLARLTKWFEQENVKNDGKHGYTAYLKLSEEGIKHRMMLQEVADAAEWMAWPMVCPPLDWSVDQRGGYLLHHPGADPDLIHNDKGTIPSQAALDAINKQQRVAFQINRFIYDVQRSLLGKQHEIGAFTSYEAESWVDQKFPRFDPSVWEKPADDPEKRKAKRLLKYAYNAQKKAEKLAKNPYRVLKQVARFVNVPKIYFSCFFDSRLRIYTHSVGLTYQGSDYQKALLQFADGVEVTNQNKDQVRKELLVSLANCWGNDKITFKERIEFASDLIKDLAYVAQDPLSSAAYSVWTDADEPFQFLALLREYFELFVWHTKTVAQVPGGRDATNSGSQILGGMCRDTKTCFYTNVVLQYRDLVSDSPQDLYGVVARKAKVYLKNDVWVGKELERYRKEALKKAEKNGYVIKTDFAMNLDPEILSRSHFKRMCMVDSYGGSWQSKNEYVGDELVQTGKENGFKVSLAEKRLVTTAGILAQANEFPLSTELNKWFKKVGKAAIDADLKLIQWQTPDGSHIVQEYRVPNMVQVTTYAMGGGTYWQALQDDNGSRKDRSSSSIQAGYKDEIMEGKTQTALGANFTHSHDSCIIRGAMNDLETPFFGVHDCIYGPHGTLETACNLMRHSYYQTVKGDALQGLIDINELVCDPAPRGDADISVCLNSPYMFC